MASRCRYRMGWMMKYFQLATDITDQEISALQTGMTGGTIHPRDVKMKLAHTFVRMYHGEEAAEAAQKHFITLFQQRALPDEIEEVVLASAELEEGQIRLVKLLTALGLQASGSEAKRSIQQGACLSIRIESTTH